MMHNKYIIAPQSTIRPHQLNFMFFWIDRSLRQGWEVGKKKPRKKKMNFIKNSTAGVFEHKVCQTLLK